MSKFSSNDRIANERQNWKAREEALNAARKRLDEEGYLYPVWDRDISYLEFYEKIRKYSELETKYMLEELRGERKSAQTSGEIVDKWTPYVEK